MYGHSNFDSFSLGLHLLFFLGELQLTSIRVKSRGPSGLFVVVLLFLHLLLDLDLLLLLVALLALHHPAVIGLGGQGGEVGTSGRTTALKARVGGGRGRARGGGGVLVVVKLFLVGITGTAAAQEGVQPRFVGVREVVVPAEALGVDEGLTADIAGVRPLAGVPQSVALEAGRVLIGLAAVGAVVRPHVAVRGHVRVQVGDVAEGLVAHAALVRGRRAVGRLVLLQMGLLPESLVAHNAFERSFT